VDPLDDRILEVARQGRTTMVWQTLVRTEAGKLCAVVTQTQLVIGP
jgi:acyl-coenzyme A thioesterase PaaI-like protein